MPSAIAPSFMITPKLYVLFRATVSIIAALILSEVIGIRSKLAVTVASLDGIVNVVLALVTSSNSPAVEVQFVNT